MNTQQDLLYTYAYTVDTHSTHKYAYINTHEHKMKLLAEMFLGDSKGWALNSKSLNTFFRAIISAGMAIKYGWCPAGPYTRVIT